MVQCPWSLVLQPVPSPEGPQATVLIRTLKEVRLLGGACSGLECSSHRRRQDTQPRRDRPGKSRGLRCPSSRVPRDEACGAPGPGQGRSRAKRKAQRAKARGGGSFHINPSRAGSHSPAYPGRPEFPWFCPQPHPTCSLRAVGCWVVGARCARNRKTKTQAMPAASGP